MNDAFEPQQKNIYKYSDGSGKTVSADPLILRAQISHSAVTRGKNVNELIDAVNQMDVANADPVAITEGWTALMMLAEIATEAFGLVPFNRETGEGADTGHAIGVLNHFHLWLEKKNQQHAPPQISTPASESTSAIPQTTAT